GLRHARQMLDRRLPFEIFELNAQALLARQLFFRIAADVTLALEHVEHMRAQLRGGRQDGILACLLAVADAGAQVTQWIGACHIDYPYQLDLITPGIRPLLASSRSMIRDRRNLR